MTWAFDFDALYGLLAGCRCRQGGWLLQPEADAARAAGSGLRLVLKAGVGSVELAIASVARRVLLPGDISRSNASQVRPFTGPAGRSLTALRSPVRW